MQNNNVYTVILCLKYIILLSQLYNLSDMIVLMLCYQLIVSNYISKREDLKLHVACYPIVIYYVIYA